MNTVSENSFPDLPGKSPSCWSMSAAMKASGYLISGLQDILVQLHLLPLTGEAVTFEVPSSVLGQEVRKMVAKHMPCKAGAKLTLHIASSGLPLKVEKTLQEERLGTNGEIVTLSCTFVATDVYDAWRCIEGMDVAENEFTLEGVTRLEGVTHYCLKHFPGSLKHLGRCNKFQSFQSNLENVTWPSIRLVTNSIRPWNMWFCRTVFRAWLLVTNSIRAWNMWFCHTIFRAWHLVVTWIRSWKMWHSQSLDEGTRL